MSEKELLESLNEEFPKEKTDAEEARARFEKEFDETRNFIQLIMRTIFAVIIDLTALGLCMSFHVKNLMIYGLLAAATVLIAFYIYAIVTKIKEKKKNRKMTR